MDATTLSGGPVIEAAEVAAYCVPTDGPEADGTLAWHGTELVVVHLRAGGRHGLGYSYTAARPAAQLMCDKLLPHIIGQPAFDLPSHWATMTRQLRNVGCPGLGMMAIAAIDIALWDLKAKLLELPLGLLLGRARAATKAYGSGGFTTYTDERLCQQLQGWLEQGLASVKIKLDANTDEAVRRIALTRDTVGAEVELMVDLNGACHRRGALALMEQLRPFEVCWVEEPVSSDDLVGLAWLRERAPSEAAIAAGEYGWDGGYFHRMLTAGAVDILQADATRCGYTGFITAAQLCDTQHIPLSAHCAPALHASICTALPSICHIEYFHDHARLESQLFDGVPRIRDGQLWPDLTQPGHGLELKFADAEAYRLR